MATPLTHTTRRLDDGSVVLTAVGELDLSNIGEFDQALSAATDLDVPVVVDLSGVEYLDSGAINVLFTYAKRVELIANPILIPVLKVSGLVDVTNVRAAPPTPE